MSAVVSALMEVVLKIGQRLHRWFTRRREYVLIVLILGCLTCLFLNDVIFDGKILLAADIALQYAPWNSITPDSSVHNATLSDSIMWYYPAKHFFWQSVKGGHFPKWNPYIYSGHPFSPLSGGQSSDLGQLLTEFPALFLPVERALGYVAALRLVLAGLFMYAFLRDLRASVYGSLLAAIVFMFNANTIAWLEFPAHLSIQLWIPLVFLLLHRALTKESLVYACLTAAVLGLLLFNWYLLLAIYTLSGLALFALWMILRTYFEAGRDLRRLLRQVAISVGSVGAGVSMVVVKIISYRLLLDVSIREGQSALRALRSVPLTLETLRNLVSRSVTFFVPAFYGNGASYPYWGYDNPVEAAQYFGIITIILVAIVLVLGRKNRYALFFAGTGILFLLITWRIPPFVNLYGYIPSVHFSTISRMVTFVLFAFAVAAGLGLTYLEKGSGEGEKRRAYLGMGLAALMALVVVGWNWLSQTEAISTRPYEISNLKWFLLMLSISLGVIVLLTRSKFDKRLLAQIAVAILVADLFASGLDFNTTVEAGSVYPVTDAISFLQRDGSTYRVFPLSGHDFLFLPNSLTAYRIPEVTGYDNPLSQRYADFFREVIGDTKIGLNGVIQSTSPNRLRLLGMLNVKYIVGPASPSFEDVAGLELVYDGEVKIYRNRHFLPRAFAVHGSKVLQGKKRILAELKDPEFDPREYVILEETLQTSEVSQAGFAQQNVHKAVIVPSLKEPPLDLGGLNSEVTILRTGVDEIELVAEMGDEGFVVLSNQYYPGWRAYVDGREERIYRANYILMAVPLAEGSHTVKFVYEPAMHQINLLVRIVVPLGLVGVLLCRKYSTRRLWGVSLLGVAKRMFGGYDKESEGFTEFEAPHSVNPRNSVSYLAIVVLSLMAASAAVISFMNNPLPERPLSGADVSILDYPLQFQAVQHPLHLNLGNQIELLGYDLSADQVGPGDTLELTLYWHALTELEEDYSVFTHLLGESYNLASGNFLWGQKDGLPLDGTYPTSRWLENEAVIDSYAIAVQPDAPPGLYRIEVGMYVLETGARLPVFEDRGEHMTGDRVLLEEMIEVVLAK